MIKDLESRKSGEPSKDYLARYLKWLAEHGDEVIGNYKSGALKDQDAAEMHFLARSTEWLPSKFAELVGALDGELEPAKAEHVYSLLLMIISSANHIGHHAMFSVSAAPRYGRLRTYRMRETKAPKQDEATRLRRAAIVAECNGVEMKATYAFADSIRLDVQKQLGEHGKKGCSATNIKRDIDAILLERD